MKKLLIHFLFISFLSQAQYKIKGEMISEVGNTIKLMGYTGFGITKIDSCIVDKYGQFTLSYSNANLGMGYLINSHSNTYNIVLEKNQIIIKGKSLKTPEEISILAGIENKAFAQYAMEYPKLEQILGAWIYLQNRYANNEQFRNQLAYQSIIKEVSRLKNQDSLFLHHLPKESYVAWYLPTRKLISSTKAMIQNSPKEGFKIIKATRMIDYSDNKLYKSGLMDDLIDTHFNLIMNSKFSKDSLQTEINKSVITILNSVSKNPTQYNEIVGRLFLYFEQNSLFESSAYTANQALSQKNVIINKKLANILEVYRKMKIGNIAPDITLNNYLFQNGELIDGPKTLYGINSKYKLVIFGASWCNTCGEEMAQLIPNYEKWKKLGLEVIFISLDDNKHAFEVFTSVMPFYSYCDFKKWETDAALDYSISSSPTIYLLDSNNKILLRPNWIKAIDAWVNYTLIKI